MKRVKAFVTNDSQLSDYIQNRNEENSNFLTSPMGIFCRDLSTKGYLEADGIGATLINGFAEKMDCVQTEVVEVDLDKEFDEAKYITESAENYRIRNDLQKNVRDVLEF